MKNLSFVSLFILFLAGLAFAQDVQKQNQSTDVIVTVPGGTYQAKPQTKTVNRKVAIPKKPQPVRYVNRSSQVTTGFSVDVPDQEIRINTSQFQEQITRNKEDFDAFKQADDAWNKRQDDDITKLFGQTSNLNGRVGSLEDFRVTANQNFKNLDGRVTAVEQRPDRTTSTGEKIAMWLNFGGNLFNGFMNFRNSSRISKLEKNQNTTIVNNGGGGCWQNGRNRCGGGGGGCRGNNCGGGCRGSNCCYPMLSSSDMVSRPCGVYNPPTGGNCLVRVVGGNCNYNNGDCYSGNCGAGGPSRVPNGSGYGNGNFTGNGGNSYFSDYSNAGYNNGSSRIFLGGGSNNGGGGTYNGGSTTYSNGGGTYNTPRANNGGGGSLDNSGVIFH